jgi:predicted small metal-binding protein
MSTASGNREESDMAKVYFISCRDAGVDCDFSAKAGTVEELMQLCADHGAKEHNMKGFGPELFLKMRNCMKTLEGPHEVANS